MIYRPEVLDILQSAAMSAWELRPKAKRVLYTIRVSLKNVLDLTRTGLLDRLGITTDILQNDDQSPCRMIGGAVHWLGHDGLLVLSARRVEPGDLSARSIQQRLRGEEVIADDKRT